MIFLYIGIGLSIAIMLLGTYKVKNIKKITVIQAENLNMAAGLLALCLIVDFIAWIVSLFL